MCTEIIKNFFFEVASNRSNVVIPFVTLFAYSLRCLLESFLFICKLLEIIGTRVNDNIGFLKEVLFHPETQQLIFLIHLLDFAFPTTDSTTDVSDSVTLWQKGKLIVFLGCNFSLYGLSSFKTIASASATFFCTAHHYALVLYDNRSTGIP